MAPSLECALLLLLLAPLSVLSESASSFNYSSAGLDWPGLCQSGEFQSPVNIVRGRAQGSLAFSLSFNYEVNTRFTLLNTGHTINLIPDPAATNQLFFSGKTFNLLQMHAHVVSEHTIDGYYGAMELHFVHTNAANSSELLVLSTLLHLDQDDTTNSFITKYITNAPSTPGANITVAQAIDYLSVLAPHRLIVLGGYVPRSTLLYTYPGSLTTPSCNQGVTWVVMEPSDGPTISVSQLEAFQVLLAGFTGGVPDNNRPPNPLNGRTIKKFYALL